MRLMIGRIKTITVFEDISTIGLPDHDLAGGDSHDFVTDPVDFSSA